MSSPLPDVTGQGQGKLWDSISDTSRKPGRPSLTLFLSSGFNCYMRPPQAQVTLAIPTFHLHTRSPENWGPRGEGLLVMDREAPKKTDCLIPNRRVCGKEASGENTEGARAGCWALSAIFLCHHNSAQECPG